MVYAKMGQAAYVPAYQDTAKGQNTYIDVTNQVNTTTQIKFFFIRDNGDMPGPDWAKAHTYNIGPERTFRVDIARDWKISGGGITVKVEVLSGGPVLVTYKPA